MTAITSQPGADLPSRVAAYLSHHHVATLASVGAEGVWAAAVFYVHDGHSL